MTLEQLVAKQQLEIERLQLAVAQHKQDKSDIANILVCIGGGLNDNLLGYTHEQKLQLNRILMLAENESESDE